MGPERLNLYFWTLKSSCPYAKDRTVNLPSPTQIPNLLSAAGLAEAAELINGYLDSLSVLLVLHSVLEKCI